MESMECKIRPVVCHQHNQNSQQSAKAHAGSEPDFAAGEEYRYKQHRQHRAIDIGQIVPSLGGSIAVKRA